MISDGFGPASETFGRVFYQYINNASYHHATPLDEILVGTSRTRSSDSLVTDSAAGATAFSCAIKTYNLGIAGIFFFLQLLLLLFFLKKINCICNVYLYICSNNNNNNNNF